MDTFKRKVVHKFYDQASIPRIIIIQKAKPPGQLDVGKAAVKLDISGAHVTRSVGQLKL